MKIKSLLFIFMLLISFCVQAYDVYQVLVVHAYNQEYPWTKSQHQGFVEEFLSDSKSQVSYSIEYLDTKRRSLTDEYTYQLESYLAEKYRDYSPDLIYVTDDNGYQFAKRSLQKLFPGVAVFFSGVNDYGVADEAIRHPIRGVFEKKQISENIELFNEIKSKGASIIIVGDASVTYEAIKSEINDQLLLHPEITAIYIESNKINQLLGTLKERDEKYLFLTTVGGIKDPTGRPLTLQQIITAIATATDAAIISMEDAYLFDGVLGGYVTSGVAQGQAAARLAKRFIKGEKIDEIAHIVQSPNQYIFNQTELERRNIELPESIGKEATLINIPPSYYERNREMILSLLAVLSFAAIWFFWLWIWSGYTKKREIRLQSEVRANRVERYQNALLEWSGVDYENLHEAFRKASEISANTLGVQRVSIWLYDDDRSTIVCHDLFVLGEGHSSGQILKRTVYPHYFNSLDRGRAMLVNDAWSDAITREFKDGYLKQNNIYSMLDIPIHYHGEVIGVVRHEHTGSLRTWTIYEYDFATAIVSNVSLSLEIDKRQAMEKQLEYQAYHDDLTGLPNRSLMMDRIEHAIRLARRDNSLLAILFMDLDNFKHINDSLGHAAGDELLMQLSERLQTTLREVDTIARMGGDEFTLLVEGFLNINEVNDVAVKLFESLQEPLFIDQQEYYVTSSIGIAVYPDDGDSAEKLLRNSDAAMYRAKDEGRNSFQFYSKDMTERAFEKILMIGSLRHALERNEFILYYQPQYDIFEENIIGFEALIRWQHPELGLVAPAQFILAAEDSGLIVPIDRWVMREGCKQIKQWRQNGLTKGRLSLNLTTHQLDQPDLMDFLTKTLTETGCAGDWIAFEVTEGQIMKNPERSISMLNEISALGIEIAVDDFGTGYSSLSYLKKLPVDTLKIDQSFIRDVPDDDDDSAIVRSVIALAASLKLNVVAEGVETKEQLDFLYGEGCSKIQGYYYSPPKAAFEIEKRLNNKKRKAIFTDI
jgi:diguanylate cyclase (GGDEF)-like protein